MKRYLFLTVGIISTAAFCQTGPGGVGSSSTNKMWLDANTLGLANGSQVGTFSDVSGNGNDVTQSTSSRRPTFTETGLNGLPVVTFDGVNDFMERGTTSGLETTNLTWFIVYQKANLTAQSLIDNSYTSQAGKWGSYCNPSNNRMISKHKSPTQKSAYYNDANVPTFLSAHITPSSIRTYNQGALAMTTSGTYTVPSGHTLMRLGGYTANTTSYLLNGFIAEVLVFNTSLNNLERILVENYLGNKYGLAIPTDRYDYQATHNIGVIGIGNDGTNSHSDSRGNDIFHLSNPSSLSSGDHMLVGHTNDPLTDFTTTDIPVSLVGHQRFTRTWRVDETNDVGTVTVTFHLDGGNNFGSSSTYRMLIDNSTQDGNFTDAQIVTGTYNASLQTMTFTGVNLNDGDYVAFCGVEQILDIQSVTTGPWSDPNTWDCVCVPTQNDNVTIMPFNNVTVDANAETGNFAVETDGTLTMSSDVQLSIYGDWDINGTLALTDGEIIIAGTSDQYMDSGGNTVAFNDLTIDSDAEVTVYFGTYEINGLFTPNAGSFVIDTDPEGEFIINSTSATTTGRVGPIGTGFSMTGNIIVRRFLPAGSADYRNLASPVVGADLSMWDADIEISGEGFPDGCAYGNGGCFYSVRYYNNNTFVNVTNPNEPLTNTMGYEVFIGDDLTSFAGATLSSKGTLNTGDVDINIGANWHTRGNPYACPIEMKDATYSGVGKYFYIYDPAIGGYQWWDGTSGSSSSIPELADGRLAIGQGMWMVGPGTVTVNQGLKVTTGNGTFIRSNESDEQLKLTILQEGTTYQTMIALQSGSVGTDNYDELIDMPNLETGSELAPGFGFDLGENNVVRKNHIAADMLDKKFNIYTNIHSSGYYSIEISNWENFDNYRSILLFDNVTNETIDLKNEGRYVFFSDEFQGNRFTLILSNSDFNENQGLAGIQIDENGISITQMGSIVSVESGIEIQNATISLVNLLGQEVVFEQYQTIINGKTIINLPSDLHGVFIFVIEADGMELISKKLVL